MRRAGQTLLSVLLTFALACSPPTVDRARWQTMPRDEKLLYVKSLLGGEKAKEAKGGNSRAYPRPAEEYVARIDAAYARGETGDPATIFGTLAERR